ncbi:hypothetical protein CF15_00070 [Pyrodictium occultum]|uniref:Alcohol dehydrogenase-like N-terminal domain-containing protein n=1 Tax=Pyrodictium occultum TaxID=2309 RepID=A0A0V8RTB5_PYROC|nr:hypothetical protein [Pyrodictium occultum]KSW11307.1 hypothetical protein CF15_00070 [Pyrodictium occultum]
MATANPAIVWRGEPMREERLPPLVPRGWVLLRVEYARWCPLDSLAAAGAMPLENGTVLGCSGVGIVLEAGVDADTGLAGRRVAPARLSADHLPPFTGDGFLAAYTAAPSSVLAEVQGPDPIYTFLPEASLACEAAREAMDSHRVLIAGAGPFGLLAALAIWEEGGHVLVYAGRREAREAARSLGLEAVEKPQSRVDTVVAATASLYTLEKLIEATVPGKLLLHPLYTQQAWPGCRRCRRLEAVVLEGGAPGCARRLLEKARRLIESNIGVVEGLEPPPLAGGPLLGYVYRLGREA